MQGFEPPVDLISLKRTYREESEIRSCLCGSTRNFVIKRGDRYKLPIKYALCLDCGHVYTKNVLAPYRTVEFYSSSAYRTIYTNGASPEDTIIRKTPTRNGQSKLLSLTTAILKVSKGSVLEWGCGGGWNLVPFADAGFHTIGVDFDDTYVRAGARINSLDLRQISDETLAELSRLKFDVVILNHVLEHSVNPLQLLIDLRSLCTASTHLIVGLPTIESMSIWGFSEYFHIAHLDYYCRSSFVRLAAQAGFLCVYMEVSKGLFVLVPSTVRKIPVSRRNVVSSMSMVFRSWLGYFVKHQIIRMARITRTEKALRSIANRPNK